MAHPVQITRWIQLHQSITRGRESVPLNRGKSKAVGVTASGTTARTGTLAADTDIFPFGTIIYIPGYGYGRVEDRGGDIKGYHLDLFYPTHGRALQQGRVKTRVKVWFPPGYTPKG
jgi:3D (Asp-Asp-Asp) domain-containing protein